MSPEREQRVCSIFEAVLRCDPPKRAARLDELCAGDVEVRAAVERLLADDERASRDQFLTPPDVPVGTRDGGRPGLVRLVDLNGHIRCPHCQNPIELVTLPDSGEVLCTSCGSTFRIETESTASWGGSLHGRTLDRFVLLSRVGAGAFGTVYKARDPKLDRIVAVKVPRAGNLPGGQELDRFLREARSTAQLRHPAIVPVYEVGQEDSLPYLVSDFVEGVTLDDRLTAGSLAFRESAGLVAAVSDALGYAHRQGIVHRDVKPSNIMLRTDGSPVIMDFGLAKRAAGEITMTIDGLVLGTPAYMSPEQARGEAHKVDGRSDVYSLGVVLYRLLTGDLPFHGNQRMLVHQVLHDEPKPPRKLNDRIPRDLETICLKAMEKVPDKRYSTAQALADDLRRWLAGEPIHARPVGRIEKAWRWCQRRPSLAATGAIAALLLVAVSVVSVLFAVSERHVARVQSNARAAAEEAGRREAVLRGEAETVRKAAVANFEDAEAQRKVAEAKTAEARAKTQELEYQNYVTLIALSQRETEANNIQLSDRLLERTPPRLRGWEWHYCNRVNHRELSTLRRATNPHHITEAALSPDGRRLACFDHKVAWVCDLEGHEQTSMKGHDDQIETIAWSPDGKTVATGGRDHAIRLWDAESGAERACLRGHSIWVIALCFSPDGTRLLSGAGAYALTPGRRDEVKLWQLAEPREARTLMSAAGKGIDSVAYSPDGKHVAAGHSAGVLLWDVETGAEAGRFVPVPQSPVTGVAFSPDGHMLAAGSFGGGISLWDLRSGESLWDLQSVESHWDLRSGEPAFGLRGHEGMVRVRFRPDGRRLVSAGNEGVVRLWDPKTGRNHATLRGHSGGKIRPEFDPSGARLITSSSDGTIRTWDVTAESIPPLLTGHKGWAYAVSFHPNGRTVATGGWGGIFIWDAASGRLLQRIAPVHDGGPRAIAYSKDGRRIAAVGMGPLARVWDTATWGKILDIDTGTRAVQAVAFSPDGSVLIIGDDDGLLSTWDLTTGDVLSRIRAHDRAILSLSISPDGREVVTATEDDTVKVWRLSDRVMLHSIKSAKSNSMPSGQTAVFDATGRRLAVRRPNHSVGIIDMMGGWTLHNLPGHSAEVNAIAFSPDGRRLATGGKDRSVRIWDLDWGQEVLVLQGHRDAVSGLAWSDDGRFLVSVATDGTGRVWDAGPHHGPYNPVVPDRQPPVRFGEFVVNPDGQEEIKRITYSPDGRTMALACGGGSVKLWDAASRMVRGVLTGHTAPVVAVAFSPDGNTLATGAGDWHKKTEPGELRLWDVKTCAPLAALKGHTGPVWSLAFTPDGKILASGASDGLVKLWDPARHEERATIDVGGKFWIRGLAFTPDGRTLVSSHRGRVQLRDLNTLKTIQDFQCHTEEISAIALAPDGRTLATASRDQTAALWDMASTRKLATIVGNNGWVNEVAFSPEGKSLAVAVRDGTVKLWDVAEGRPRWVGRAPEGGAFCVALSRDGKTVASARFQLVLWQFAD